jgi:polyribonucleotide nucleotidyltransferase
LTLSDIPFEGPIGAVRVGMIDGKFIINPTYDEQRDGQLKLMVVGSSEGIVMIEAGAAEVDEKTVVDAIEFGHTEIKKICAALNELREKAGKPKRAVVKPELDEAYISELKAKVGERLADALNTEKYPKLESAAKVKEIKKELRKRSRPMTTTLPGSLASTSRSCASVSSATM